MVPTNAQTRLVRIVIEVGLCPRTRMIRFTRVIPAGVFRAPTLNSPELWLMTLLWIVPVDFGAAAGSPLCFD